MSRLAGLARPWPRGAAAGRLRLGGPRPAGPLLQRRAAASSPAERLERLLEVGHRTTARPLEHARGLPPGFYADAAYCEHELCEIYGSQWFCVGHATDVAEPGSVRVVEVAGTSILVTRDRGGRVHAFYNVCMHRGARVCREDRTGCRQLVCPYHHWAYRLDGSLKAAPPMAAPPPGTAEREALALRRLPGLEVFAGLIFVNQSPDAPPLLEALGDLPEKLARFDLDGRLEVRGVKEYDIRANWKAIAENFLDFYHLPSVHPLLHEYLKLDEHKAYQGHGQYVGYATTDTALNAADGPGDSSSFNHFPRITKTEAGSTLFFVIFPNVCLTVMPHSAYTLISYPGEDPARTRQVLTLLLPRGARAEGDTDARFEEKRRALLDFVVQLNDEDVEAVENLQDGLRCGRRLDFGPFYVREYDWPVHRFHNLVLSGLQGSSVDESLMPAYDQEIPRRVAAEL